MTTKPRRHKTIRIVCKNCGTEFDTLATRQKRGQGNFCSMKCYREFTKLHPSVYEHTGKENARIYFDEKRKCRMVYWYDAGTNKRHNSTYARWWWELNKGEIPDGCVVVEINENEYDLVLRSTLSRETGKKLSGRQFSNETKQKMSASAKGKIISDETKKRMGDALRLRWAEGKFDNVHVGENSHRWRGGTSFEIYPREFSRSLKEFIRSRDNYQCQICSKRVYKSRHGHVHHIDGNKANNDIENLVLLCSSCHEKIHAGGSLSPALQAFRDRLYE